MKKIIAKTIATAIEIEHREMVKKLAKPGENIIKDLNNSKAHLLHMAFALVIEAGELADPIKKHTIYGAELDASKLNNIIEELGDIEFYLKGIRTELSITREDTLLANVKKLAKRYGTKFKYSNTKAIARVDKVVAKEQKIKIEIGDYVKVVKAEYPNAENQFGIVDSMHDGGYTVDLENGCIIFAEQVKKSPPPKTKTKEDY